MSFTTETTGTTEKTPTRNLVALHYPGRPHPIAAVSHVPFLNLLPISSLTLPLSVVPVVSVVFMMFGCDHV